MLAYLFQQQLITCQQFAFLSKCSTCNQLFDYINDWILSVRNRHSVDVIYFDFPEAFYSVSHPKLVHKIHAYGFSGCIPNILKDFLSARTQRVVFCLRYFYIPPCCYQCCACATGSVFFLVYINDIVMPRR